MSSRPPLVAAAHELANAVRTSDPDAEVAASVQRLIEEAVRLLAQSRHPGPYACEQLRPPDDGFVFDLADLCGSVPYAPLTGPYNPVGGEVRLWADNGGVSGELVFTPIHAGPMNMVHGGVLAGVFDEVMALATLVYGIAGFTRQMTVDYRATAELGRVLSVQAKVGAVDGRDVEVQAIIADGERIIASATARFRKIADLSEDFYAVRN